MVITSRSSPVPPSFVERDHRRVVVAQGGAGCGPVPGHGGAKEKAKILKEKEKGKENEEM
jgi:hypothetical protein